MFEKNRNIIVFVLVLCLAVAVILVFVNLNREMEGGNSGVSTNLTQSPQSWIYLLSRPLTWEEVNMGYKVYIIDLFDNSPEIIKALNNRGSLVICYFSAGTWEEWRPDAGEFPPETIKKPLENWPGERWLDVRNEAVREVMKKRLDLAADKGCDGVDPDNTDFYLYDTGFNYTKEDAIAYIKFLSEEAHKRGLKIGLKNNGELVSNVIEYVDFAVVESCFKYNECDLYKPFIEKGKNVFVVEYELPKNEFCPIALSNGFSAAKACPELDGCWDPCP